MAPAKKTKAKAKPPAKSPAKAKAKPAAPKPRAPRPVAARASTRTRAPTVSERAETSRTRAATATDLRSQIRRTRAATVSERAETPRTRARTERPGALGAPPTTTTPRRSRSDTVIEPPREPAAAPPRRSRADTTIDLAPPSTVTAHGPHELGNGRDASDPARAAELARLEVRIDQLEDPEVLVALASQIDTLGMQLAFEISRHAHDEAHVAPLKPVLIRVPAIYGRALIRAAEKFDDRGSPKRAAYVLFEALRKAFDADVISSVSAALSFILDAHGQGAAASRLRALIITRDQRRAAGVDRKQVRLEFGDALAQLRDRGVDWTALADDPPQFD